ncbi:MAG: gfo/Idh/MocA family oxidoreductase [Nitrososphaeraceae archaeon]|nr:gfo/Idh/MocA family oxidoreductase [Nitrososphaeraceae archaeon]
MVASEYANLHVAVIGVGGWGKNHARVLSNLGALRAVCDMDVKRGTEISEKYNVNCYTSLDQMLEEEQNLDACFICTPTKSHYKLATRIIDKGIHLFVEKPLSFSSKECDNLVELAQNKKIILTAGYIERYNPVVQDVKRIIQSKKYGDPLMMEFHRENRMPVHITDVGIIYDTSVHDIDTAMYLFDSKPIVVFARTGKKFHSFEDFATIMLGFEDQRVAIIASNWITPKRVRRFSAVCTDGIITGDFISQEIRIDDMDATTIPRREFKEPLSVEITSFLDGVAGTQNSGCPLVSSIEATRVTKVAESAILSSNTGSPIYLDFKGK